MGKKYKVGDIVTIQYPEEIWLMKVTKVSTSNYAMTIIDGEGNNNFKPGHNFDFMCDSVDSDNSIHLLDTTEWKIEAQKHLCLCEIRALLMNGCKCGGV